MQRQLDGAALRHARREKRRKTEERRLETLVEEVQKIRATLEDQVHTPRRRPRRGGAGGKEQESSKVKKEPTAAEMAEGLAGQLAKLQVEQRERSRKEPHGAPCWTNCLVKRIDGG